jgi:hypothetical protein
MAPNNQQQQAAVATAAIRLPECHSYVNFPNKKHNFPS